MKRRTRKALMPAAVMVPIEEIWSYGPMTGRRPPHRFTLVLTAPAAEMALILAAFQTEP